MVESPALHVFNIQVLLRRPLHTCCTYPMHPGEGQLAVDVLADLTRSFAPAHLAKLAVLEVNEAKRLEREVQDWNAEGCSCCSSAQEGSEGLPGPIKNPLCSSGAAQLPEEPPEAAVFITLAANKLLWH